MKRECVCVWSTFLLEYTFADHFLKSVIRQTNDLNLQAKEKRCHVAMHQSSELLLQASGDYQVLDNTRSNYDQAPEPLLSESSDTINSQSV